MQRSFDRLPGFIFFPSETKVLDGKVIKHATEEKHNYVIIGSGIILWEKLDVPGALHATWRCVITKQLIRVKHRGSWLPVKCALFHQLPVPSTLYNLQA